ncbi:hypothetical protein [Flavobacterium sp. CFS9]
MSRGLSTALIIDGVYRIGTNSARLGMYLYGENKMGDALPSSGGALIGSVIDGMNGGKFGETGSWQKGLGAANDMASFLVTGGNGQAYASFLELSTFYGYDTIYYGGAIVSNWYTIISYIPANPKK